MVSGILIIKVLVYFENEIDLYCASAFDVYKDSHYSGVVDELLVQHSVG